MTENENTNNESTNHNEEQALVHAKEVYSLSKLEGAMPPTVIAAKAVRGLSVFTIILLAIVGLISLIIAFTLVPALYKYESDKSKSLKTEIKKRDEKILAMDVDKRLQEYKRRDSVQRSLIYNLRYTVDKYRLKIDKSYYNEMEDMDLSDKITANMMVFKREINREGVSVTHGNRDFKEIALTFDLGTGDDIEILYNLIIKYGVMVTVLLSNEMPQDSYGSLLTEKNRKYIGLLHSLGVEFGNHTWSHYYLPRSISETSYKKRLFYGNFSAYPITFYGFGEEFAKVEKVFSEITGGGKLAPVWRAPYGGLTKIVLDAAASYGYEYHIYWDIDLLDYVSKNSKISKFNPDQSLKVASPGDYYTSEEMLKSLIKLEKTRKEGMNGAIILAHLGGGRKDDKMIHMLPKFIAYCDSLGYQFVSATECLNNQLDTHTLKQEIKKLYPSKRK